ncbi:MAG: GTPase Era [Acidimicrobiia bacterium]|nr:GTPase Era [Acidimicrobiia bacterium]MDX2467266.1 GTPase Era [Acidimicrobiia bacterium]
MRSGFISVVGRPNVGKSTLVNALVGEKVSITSSRPQTTRNTIRGILNKEDMQIVFVDTPGLHRPRTALGSRLNRLVYGSLEETDAVLFVLDATQKIGPGDRLIAERLQEANATTIVVVNKTDIANEGQILEQLSEAAEWDFAAYVPVSARNGIGTSSILEEVIPLLEEGPQFFPSDVHMDQPEKVYAGELIREKFLHRLREELPHSLAIVVEEIEPRDSGVIYVGVTAYVERKSQKGIVIGKGGSLLKTVGAEARTELERFFGRSVYLDIRVKIQEDWQRHDEVLDRLGF